jgi:MSHA biogenesis protein MshI
LRARVHGRIDGGPPLCTVLHCSTCLRCTRYTMLDLGSFGRSTLRSLGLARSGPGRHARAGVVFGPEHATLLRVSGAHTAPQLQAVQRVAVDAGRRGDVVRRWVNAGHLRDAGAVVVLAAGEYDLLQMAAPNVPDEEVRDALRWQLRGTLPYSPEEAALDFVRVPQPAEAPQRATLLVVVAPRSTVALAVGPLLEQGVEIDAVDVPEFAQRNLQPLAGAAAERTGAWLGFETNACLLTVQLGGELAFARRIPVTGMTQDIGTEHQLAYLADRIGTQVQRSLDLLERQLGLPSAAQVMVSPHQHAAYFARELAERTALPVNVFDIAALAQGVSASGDGQWSHDHMLALGACLRSAEAPATPAATAWTQLLGRLRRAPAAVAAH